jgi:drug/metabolite transporter (DMT)-like permease
VSVRFLTEKKVNVLIPGYYSGVLSLITTGVVLLVPGDSLMHVQRYDVIDIFYLLIVGIASISYQVTLTLANKYTMASKLAPLTNLENVFTILADIFIFHYHLVETDIIGMVIVIICIWQ